MATKTAQDEYRCEHGKRYREPCRECALKDAKTLLGEIAEWWTEGKAPLHFGTLLPGSDLMSVGRRVVIVANALKVSAA